MNRRKNVFFDLLSAGGCSDLLHDVVNLSYASWVDGSALLLTGHAADVGGNVVQDGGEGDIDDIGLAEGAGDGELISGELVQGLGVEVADKELGAIVDVLAVLLEEDGVEVLSGSLAMSVSSTSSTSTESTSGNSLSDNSSLDGSTDESLGDQDLCTDDDGGGEDELGLDVDDGHADDEGEHQENGLHFAVIGFLAFVLRKK
jgi:hypothetical protein